MSESPVGFNVAATRQKAGRFLNRDALGGPPARPLGGVKPPGATLWASVMVVSGSASESRLSHEAAKHGMERRESKVVFMALSFGSWYPCSIGGEHFAGRSYLCRRRRCRD